MSCEGWQGQGQRLTKLKRRRKIEKHTGTQNFPHYFHFYVHQLPSSINFLGDSYPTITNTYWATCESGSWKTCRRAASWILILLELISRESHGEGELIIYRLQTKIMCREERKSENIYVLISVSLGDRVQWREGKSLLYRPETKLQTEGEEGRQSESIR